MTSHSLTPAVAMATAIAAVLACGGSAATPTSPSTTTTTTSTTAFTPSVTVRTTETSLIIESNGIPDHAYGPFPNASNPNSVLTQSYQFTITRNPTRATTPTSLPMGPIGVMTNGIPFYNPYNAQGNNAVEGPFAETFDACDGHPDQRGSYHYHKIPSCLVKDTPGQHSALYGYALDGYALYGPQDDGGGAPSNLDSCNGHTDATRGYHYHMSRAFPYLLGCYSGRR
jgi:hypothetical protein